LNLALGSKKHSAWALIFATRIPDKTKNAVKGFLVNFIATVSPAYLSLNSGGGRRVALSGFEFEAAQLKFMSMHI
jgi:hypothetical protein